MSTSCNVKMNAKSIERAKYIIHHWRNVVLGRRYDAWCEIHNEEVFELELSHDKNMGN